MNELKEIFAGITILVFLSALGQAVWQTLKMTWQEGKISFDRIGVLVVCVTITLLTNESLFARLGIELTYPIVGVILTGVLLSNGAEWLHEFLKKYGILK